VRSASEIQPKDIKVMNRFLATTSVVVLALMTTPVMAQSSAPVQPAPAPTAQPTTPAAPGAAIAPSTTAAPSAPAAAVVPSVAPAVGPAAAPSTQRPSEADTARLIGRTIRNAAEESIGEIASVVIARDGSVSSVIVGVGGFLGVGQREVAIRWQDLQVTDNGATVHTNVTREQLAAMPVYQYAPNQRPGVIAFPTTMSAPATPATAAPAMVAPTTPATAAHTTAARDNTGDGSTGDTGDGRPSDGGSGRRRGGRDGRHVGQ
jgi:hypothetical protein